MSFFLLIPCSESTFIFKIGIETMMFQTYLCQYLVSVYKANKGGIVQGVVSNFIKEISYFWHFGSISGFYQICSNKTFRKSFYSEKDTMRIYM